MKWSTLKITLILFSSHCTWLCCSKIKFSEKWKWRAVRFSCKRTMTEASTHDFLWVPFPQSDIELFVLFLLLFNSVAFCQAGLALNLTMGFNPDLTQKQLVSSFCFQAVRLSYTHSWWATFWLIRQDFLGRIIAGILWEDYKIISKYLTLWFYLKNYPW